MRERGAAFFNPALLAEDLAARQFRSGRAAGTGRGWTAPPVCTESRWPITSQAHARAVP
jgi:hypothetical protein